MPAPQDSYNFKLCIKCLLAYERPLLRLQVRGRELNERLENCQQDSDKVEPRNR